jgi:hypothetical protein
MEEITPTFFLAFRAMLSLKLTLTFINKGMITLSKNMETTPS